jgi:aromatic ring-opening dioxygenase catalytic subunit (LigB family)
MSTPARLPTLFIPHGGGPCFFMEPMPGMPADTWDRMAAYLRGIPKALGQRPEAVLVISGHWETEQATVLNTDNYELLYDYYGFPEHTYSLTYPAHGSAPVAARVRELLGQAGIDTDEQYERGLDHGVFIPFKLIYPDADIPIVQLSLLHSLDPAAHFAIGKALAPLRDEGVLIIGSGLSYHNLRYFFRTDATSKAASDNFDTWLGDAITAEPSKREQLLINWQQAPNALDCHPRSEHLIPLMVAAGAAVNDAGHIAYNDRVLGKSVSGFLFGNAPAL